MHRHSQDMLDTLHGSRQHSDEASTAPLLRHHAEPLATLESGALGEMFDRYADARVVLIGEASHGTHELYRVRAAITQRVIEQHGFKIVAVEADWPDAGYVDRYVRGQAPAAWKRHIFSRFPTWMWRNAEVKAFTDWLRQHNLHHPAAKRAEFRGLDVYSLRNSIHEVLDYLDRTDPALAREARGRYGCLTPWQDNPAQYGRFVEHGGLMPCEAQVVEQLNVMLTDQLAGHIRDGDAFFDAHAERPRGAGSIIGQSIEARRLRGICATVTCSIRCKRCSSAAALTLRPWYGHTTRISAMRLPRKWAGRGNSTSGSFAATPMVMMRF